MAKTTIFSRRSILRGLGAGGLLASGLWRTASAQPTAQPSKAAFFYFANGTHPNWAPQGSGTSFTLTPHLQGLAPVRNEIIVFRKLMAQRNMRINPHKGATLDLSGPGDETTFDQHLAAHVRATGATPVPSLELAAGRTTGGGGVAPSLSRVKNQFLPGIRNPLFAYQRIAGAISPGNPMTQDPSGVQVEKALAARRSLLDFLKEDVGLLRVRVGSSERQRIDAYLDSLRDLEGKLGGLSGEIKDTMACKTGTAPATAMNFEARVSDLPMVDRMYMDIIAMAFACGATRVASIMWGGGECNEPVGFMGVGGWHSTSHQNPNSAGQAKLIKLQSYFCEEYAYFLEKLKMYGIFDSTVALLATQNGNSTESGFSVENHDRHNALFILSGGGNGYFPSRGKVVDCDDRNHNDLYVHMAKAFGAAMNTVGQPSWNRGPLPGVV